MKRNVLIVLLACLGVTAAYADAFWTDRSNGLITGGTGQQMMPANGVRKRVIIQNPCTAAGQGISTSENMYINFGAAASVLASSLELLPCGSFDSGAGGAASTETINVSAATTGHRWVAKEM